MTTSRFTASNCYGVSGGDALQLLTRFYPEGVLGFLSCGHMGVTGFLIPEMHLFSKEFH